MKREILTLALCLLCLSGCAGRPEGGGTAPSPTPAAAGTAMPSPGASPTAAPPSAAPVTAAPPPPATDPPAVSTPEPAPSPEEAAPTDEEVFAAFDRAAEAMGWFGRSPLPCGLEELGRAGEEGQIFRPVACPGLETLADLRLYLKGLFSDEITDELLGQGRYKDVEGVLHVRDLTEKELEDLDLAAPPSGSSGGTVERESGTRILFRLDGAEYPFQRVGDKWIFTEFPWLLQPFDKK